MPVRSFHSQHCSGFSARTTAHVRICIVGTSRKSQLWMSSDLTSMQAQYSSAIEMKCQDKFFILIYTPLFLFGGFLTCDAVACQQSTSHQLHPPNCTTGESCQTLDHYVTPGGTSKTGFLQMSLCKYSYPATYSPSCDGNNSPQKEYRFATDVNCSPAS